MKANTILAMRECRCNRVRERLSTGEKTYFVGWEKGSHLFLAAATFIFGGSQKYSRRPPKMNLAPAVNLFLIEYLFTW